MAVKEKRRVKAEIKDAKARTLNRLKRIEGQIRGLRSMLEKGRACQDVLVQYAAVHAALTSVGHIIVTDAMGDCVVRNLDKKLGYEKAVGESLKVFLKYAEHLK
jgi:DNA-binding FrmR family transcriptional regulator